MSTSQAFFTPSPLCVMMNWELLSTINLDYRSLYLHFEDGVWICRNKVVMDIKEDFVETLHYCSPVTLEFCKNRNIFVRIMQNILRLFAPML